MLVLTLGLFCGRRREASLHVLNKFWCCLSSPAANYGIGSAVLVCLGSFSVSLETLPETLRLAGTLELAGIDLSINNLSILMESYLFGMKGFLNQP